MVDVLRTSYVNPSNFIGIFWFGLGFPLGSLSCDFLAVIVLGLFRFYASMNVANFDPAGVGARKGKFLAKVYRPHTRYELRNNGPSPYRLVTIGQVVE